MPPHLAVQGALEEVRLIEEREPIEQRRVPGTQLEMQQLDSLPGAAQPQASQGGADHEGWGKVTAAGHSRLLRTLLPSPLYAAPSILPPRSPLHAPLDAPTLCCPDGYSSGCAAGRVCDPRSHQLASCAGSLKGAT